jgi:hypothetical protein
VNCDAVHRCLLALERLDEVPADVRKHLDACGGCRGMHEQLVQIETDVPLLPLPPPLRKAAFLDELVRPAPGPVDTRSSFFRLTSLFRPTSDGKREKALRKVAISVALAATLLISVIGLWLWNRETSDDGTNGNLVAGKTWLDRQRERDVRWAKADTPVERVRLLDELANDVERKALALAESKRIDDFNTELNNYQEVLTALIEQEAPQMSAEEKRRMLSPIADRLAHVESEASRLAMQPKQHPETARKLNELAMLAAEGNRQLRQLF